VLEVDIQPNPFFTNAYLADPSLDNAVSYANALRTEYFDKINTDALINAGSGLALIPIGALALFYGISGASRDVPLALGIGGAGLYAGASFLHSQPRQLIYAAGANAVTCAIAAVDPLRLSPEERAELHADILRLVLDATVLRQALSPFIDKAGPDIDYAKDVLARAEATIDQAKRADAAAAQAGRTLFNAVQQIRGLVDRAVIANQPNLDALIAGLGSALPLRAGQIAPGIASHLPKGTVQAADINEARAFPALQVAVQNVEVSIARVKTLIDRLGAGPSADTLKACTNGISAAALTFTVLPTTDLQFRAGASTPQTAAIVLSGGQSPYRWNWLGVVPGTALTAALTYDNSGSGIVTITVSPGTDTGDYTISVADATGTSKTVAVHIVNAGSGSSRTLGRTTRSQRAAGSAATPTHPLITQPTPAPEQPAIQSTPPAPGAVELQLRDELLRRGCKIDPPGTTDSEKIGVGIDEFVAKHMEYREIGGKKPGEQAILDKLRTEPEKKC
jgi:hypothetical protein